MHVDHQARIEDGAGVADCVIPLAVVERRDRSLSKVGLALARGRAMFAEIQAALVTQQNDGWMCEAIACKHAGPYSSTQPMMGVCPPASSARPANARECPFWADI